MTARSIRTVYVRSPRLASLPAVLMVWGTSAPAGAHTPKPTNTASTERTLPASTTTTTRKRSA